MRHKSIRVEVTGEDIRRGVPKSGSRCPVAHALRRALDVNTLNVRSQRVVMDTFRMNKPEKGELPRRLHVLMQLKPSVEVADFMQKFDAQQPVEPGIFQFEVEMERFEFPTYELCECGGMEHEECA